MGITKTIKDRFEKFVLPEPNSGCWLWDGSTNWKGYGTFRLRGRCTTAQRVSYELYRAPIPDGMFVLHKCDIRPCVNPDHLFLGTHADNMADMLAKGRGAKGELSGAAKLTAADVLTIRASSETGGALASRFGVAKSLIRQIRHRRVWAHIGEGEQ